MLTKLFASSGVPMRIRTSIVSPSVTLSEPKIALGLTPMAPAFASAGELPLINIHSESPVLIFEYMSTNVADDFSAEAPLAASMTPSLVPFAPITPTMVESLTKVNAAVVPSLFLTRTTSPSTVISVPFFEASALLLSKQAIIFALSGP